ncbi:ammonium transporter [Brevundimonas sp.]|uniref:ammonium transporter n=1 Tax=Brevundimonas sp. TaxID=1871086 RepID=UPI002737FD03|nr:ammonium transporter [Brevundimonas sp.]MDP3802117.1 ammonium transporter [Brevundimonas sp.]
MNKDLIGSLAWAGGLVALGLGASFARQQGYIDSETTTRIVLGATGLMVAWYGNRMPKAFAPNAYARQAARVGGWSMALSGLVYAGLWAFAPTSVALIGGCGAVLAGMAVTLGYCLSLRAKAKAA